MNSFLLKAYAKVNLDLNITGKDSSGYHILDSLVVICSDIYDVLAIEPSSKNSINVSGPFASSIDSVNILEDILSLTDRRFSINLSKNIPVGGGLGGGSSDAANLLKFLDIKLRPEELMRFGCDIVLFSDTGPKIIRGFGEQIEHISIPGSIYLLVIYPNISIKTVDIYRSFNFVSTSFSDDILKRIYNGKNDLTDTILRFNPDLSYIFETIGKIDAINYGISGSGSSCFAVFDSLDALEDGYNLIKREYPDYFIRKTNIFS